jgi:hypothetical protein
MLPIPQAAMVAAILMMFMYRPISPIPTGPSITANAFTLTMPISMLITEEAPIIALDRKIWRCELMSGN